MIKYTVAYQLQKKMFPFAAYSILRTTARARRYDLRSTQHLSVSDLRRLLDDRWLENAELLFRAEQAFGDEGRSSRQPTAMTG